MTMHKQDRSIRGSGRDGFIIVAVLWILIALATLASIFSVYLANSAVAIAVKDDAVESQLLVSSGLEFAAYQLLAPVKENERKPTRGTFRFRAGQATVEVSYAAETARIDLNAAPKAMLVGLFAALGAQGQSAESYADRIVGWRTVPKPTDTESEDPRYRSAGLAYGPRGAPFVHIDELWQVQGLPPALVERVLPFVTIYSGRPEINVFDAAPEVIAALPGMTPARLNAFLDRRESAPADPDSIPRLLGQDQVGATTDGSDAIRVRVRIGFDNGRQAASEVVVLMDLDDAPYRVLSWRDDIDAAAAGQRTTRGPR
jgi:general secretion pathway protein K